MANEDITLHVWPAKWNLPSIDPSCIAAVTYLQHTIPNKFTVAECNNPDLSPTGQLPFLVHGQHTVSCLGPIIKYIAGLESIDNTHIKPINNASLTLVERAQTTAWCAHVESNLGDLVFNTLYSHQGNWTGLTHPALVSMYPIPQRYYIPGRIRHSFQPRLEASGLWNPVDEEENKPFKKEKLSNKEETAKVFRKAFGREKVLEKAGASLDTYARLIGENNFIYRNRPTTLDIVLAAHIALLANPPYPDPFIQRLIKDSYPALISHSHRVIAEVFSLVIPTKPSDNFSLRSLVPWTAFQRPKSNTSDEDVQFARTSWAFCGLVLGALAAYLVVSGPKFEEAIERINEYHRKREEKEREEEEEE